MIALAGPGDLAVCAAWIAVLTVPVWRWLRRPLSHEQRMRALGRAAERSVS